MTRQYTTSTIEDLFLDCRVV